jgi:hypothetical protein
VKPIFEKKWKKNEKFSNFFLKNVKIGNIEGLYRPIAKNKIQSPPQKTKLKKFTNKSNYTQF